MKIPIIGRPLEYTLRVAGLWPDDSNIFGPILMASALVTTVPFQFWDALKMMDNPVMFMDILSDIMTETLLYTKLMVMWFNKSYIKDLLREMDNDYKKKEVLNKWPEFDHNARRFSKLVYSMYLGGILMYQMQFITMYIEIPIENREMILKSYYPFDYKSSPIFEIMNVIQSIQGITLTTAQALSESFIVSLVLHACGHIDLLIEQIQEFSNSCATKQKHYLLISVIKKHLKVLNLVNKIESIYTYVSLAQVILSTISMCVVGFVIITMTTHKDIIILMKFIMLYVTLMWQVFSFCFAGQHLINKSEMITSEIYNTFWYNTDLKEMKAILFILHRTQNPLTLSAGKFLTLSRQSYTTIVKTSFSYLSVLRASYAQ